MHTYVLEIIVDFLELFLFFIGTYYVVCGVFSFVKRNDVLRQDFRTNRFAVIIPAHNEGAVLGPTIVLIIRLLLRGVMEREFLLNVLVITIYRPRFHTLWSI